MQQLRALQERLRAMVDPETVIITGAQGQDGSTMSDLLLGQGYRVVGVARRKSSGETNGNLRAALQNHRFELTYGDITDAAFVNRLVSDVHPKFYFNFAAQSHVHQSFKQPLDTFQVDAVAVVQALEAIRLFSPNTRFYNACTSEVWGAAKCPADGFAEDAVFHPRSPYGVAKAAAFYASRNYREAYGLFSCSALVCNHSGPRRSVDFATRKITQGIAQIKTGRLDRLRMGNLDAFRDEGHSADYCQAIWQILNHHQPDDYVVATGTGATIRQMLEYVCSLADLDPAKVYEPDERFMRPSDVPYLLGNPAKIKTVLGWQPRYTWREVLKEMYEHDLALVGAP